MEEKFHIQLAADNFPDQLCPREFSFFSVIVMYTLNSGSDNKSKM